MIPCKKDFMPGHTSFLASNMKKRKRELLANIQIDGDHNFKCSLKQRWSRQRRRTAATSCGCEGEGNETREV